SVSILRFPFAPSLVNAGDAFSFSGVLVAGAMATGFGMAAGEIFLGVDGGGTRCRARLADRAGRILGEGVAGPANIRLGLEASLAAVMDTGRQCLGEAGLREKAQGPTTACLALPDTTDPADRAAA